ncbi:cyclase family protein [Myroides pelagicus]|uniref:Cyclase family protein n=1 Tax=Myroides pelagicus TaxID=270914 RepID=A0A7K1GL07_9FLAO|nr:cyclase family protein [Myroides pelagicus]MEC4112576.1 cyclase family protein [Myroides pelagicus]MTH29547.1 cyclase family protein [Myroides pelagicus]
MKATLTYQGVNYTIDFSQPIDLSIPLVNSDANPIAWYLAAPVIAPVTIGDWVGKVDSGHSSTNFNTVVFNPHAHGTHTECLGHITKEFYSVSESLKSYMFLAQVISVDPEVQMDGDRIITRKQLEALWVDYGQNAIVIRTLPNTIDKKSRKYSHTNPPYLVSEAAVFLREKGIEHLLIDLPSVDKEKDDGRLLAHKAFWNVKDVNDLNEDARLNATITEMIYVADEVVDGLYILNLQITALVNDASPSKPILYKIVK